MDSPTSKRNRVDTPVNTGLAQTHAAEIVAEADLGHVLRKGNDFVWRPAIKDRDGNLCPDLDSGEAVVSHLIDFDTGSAYIRQARRAVTGQDDRSIRGRSAQ